MKLNIANAVTLVRVVLVLPFWLLFARATLGWAIAAAICAFFMELSDFLDGTIARKLGAVTEVGKLLDPAADSFSRLAVFLALSTHPAPGGSEPWFPAWGVALLLFRDVGVSFTRQVAAIRGIVVAARTTGKVKALAQGGAIWIILVLHVRSCWSGRLPDELARNIALGASVFAIGVTLVSLIDYAKATFGLLQGIAKAS